MPGLWSQRRTGSAEGRTTHFSSARTMGLAARFAQRRRLSSVSPTVEDDHNECGGRSRGRGVGMPQRRFGPAGFLGRWRAEPPDKQRAPGRVLFERDVQKEAEPISCLPVAARSPEPHLQTDLRALVITVTHTMP